MKHTRILLFACLLCSCTAGMLAADSAQRAPEAAANPEVSSWGSFTSADTASSDGQYIAKHFAVSDGEMRGMIRVDVYEAETMTPLHSFFPARAADFWGVCWEEGTHNIWVQSADTGIHCYEEQNQRWLLNEAAEKPDEILSKPHS